MSTSTIPTVLQDLAFWRHRRRSGGVFLAILLDCRLMWPSSNLPDLWNDYNGCPMARAYNGCWLIYRTLGDVGNELEFATWYEPTPCICYEITVVSLHEVLLVIHIGISGYSLTMRRGCQKRPGCNRQRSCCLAVRLAVLHFASDAEFVTYNLI